MAALTPARVAAGVVVAALGFGAGFAIAHAGDDGEFPTPSLQPAANSPPIGNLERATRLPELRPAAGGGGGGGGGGDQGTPRSEPAPSTPDRGQTQPQPTPPPPTETQPPPPTETTPAPPDSSTTLPIP